MTAWAYRMIYKQRVRFSRRLMANDLMAVAYGMRLRRRCWRMGVQMGGSGPCPVPLHLHDILHAAAPTQYRAQG